MTSPEETVKLADEIRQRQAVDLHFPTFSTRGFGRRDRPALRPTPLQNDDTMTSSNDIAAVRNADDDDSHTPHEDAASADDREQPVILPDDDDEEAGNLEMDYVPSEPAQDDSNNDHETAEEPSKDQDQGL